MKTTLLAVTCGMVLAACGGKEPNRPPRTAAAKAHTEQPAKVQWPHIASPVASDPAMETKIAKLVNSMTLEQKVGQMIQAEIRDVTPEDVRKYHLGSILNGGGAFPGNNQRAAIADWVKLADKFYEASMNTIDGAPAIPIVWGTDAVHGHNNVRGATLFPHNIGLGAMRNPELMERIGAVTAAEVAVTGIDWTFAPTVAVVRDDRWGRTYESYSEDPEIVRSYAERMTIGLQGKAGTPAFLDGHHVIATAKHFIGDGGTDAGVDRGDNLSSEQQLLDIHGQGYIASLNAGAQTVMASYNSWQGWKIHGRKDLLTGVLKEQMGFDGPIVSDWDGVDEVQGCSKDTCAQAINAGIDMIMVPTQWKGFLQNTLAQVNTGAIPEARIDDAVKRILRLKYRAGLFEKGKPSSRPLANKRELIGSPEHREVARQAVRESLVLLKNSNGVLPLKRASKLLVAGSGADNIPKQAGGWSITWQGTETTNDDFPGATSVLAGIREVVGKSGNVTYSAKGDVAAGAKFDAAIVVFGEEPYAEGRGNVKTLDYQSPGDADLKLLSRLKQMGMPVVAVFLTGRPLWVNPELNASDAFVVAWLPGTEGGGISDVIFRNDAGEVNHDFKGKLSFSWPKQSSPEPLNRNDAKYDALFPYGFGLTYQDKDSLGDNLSAAQ